MNSKHIHDKPKNIIKKLETNLTILQAYGHGAYFRKWFWNIWQYIIWCNMIYGSRYSRMDQVNFLKAAFHTFFLVHSWIHWPIYKTDDIISLMLRNSVITKTIFKIGSLNLFSAKYSSRYCEILKFRGMWISGEFSLGNKLHPTKLERRSRILVKLSFRELRDSKLSGLFTFDNMETSMS